MAKKVESNKVKDVGGGGKSGRGYESGLPGKGEAGRGSSIQGKKQDAKGGPMGANQGGASRGGSRVEPSHTKRAARQDATKAGKRGS